ncbi:MAG: class I tRNA ligase family protein [Candidatus Paceibacterota bacterium]
MSEESKKIEKSAWAEREEKVLEFWKRNKIFESTLEKSEGKPEFVFYEGPPTANGKPGIHHLEARSFKDAVPRYKTMRGYHVRRKGGWDTHGLPVELQVEKALGLSSKKDIENYGVEKFNQECKESVWVYKDIWEKFTHRIGYWVDTKNPYVTYHNSYIESVWNIVSGVDKKGLLYKDYKVLPWCPRCGTALSSHELAQGYQDDKDLSVTAKFKIKGVDNGYFLAWTTTPWTLPGNVALAVGKDIDYVEAKVGNEILVLAKDRLSLLTEAYEIVAEHKGSECVGMEYEPLYPYFANLAPKDIDMTKAYKVYAADFVNTEDGTGIVHTAVMYGQDDFALGTEVGLPKFHLVKEDGHFVDGMDFLSGRFVKDEEVAVDIIKDLAGRGLLFKKEKYEHSYPHCWRCKTALIYYARDSWYIKMSSLRDELVKQNENINWEPSYIKEGRFGEWLRDIKDWAISRERYWGTPLPVWVSSDGDRLVVDSIDTLKKYSKKSGNKYFFVRHGEAVSNRDGFMNSDLSLDNPLTEKGIDQAKKEAKEIGKKGKFDMVFVSPLQRTQETAKIIKEGIGFKGELVTDKRLSELSMGEFEGKKFDDFVSYRNENLKMAKPLPQGESYRDVFIRVGEFVKEIEEKYSDKTILIVAHGAVGEALYMLQYGFDDEQAWDNLSKAYIPNAQVRSFDLRTLPLNKEFILDLHRPYIDGIVLEKDGKEYHRTKEVMDVWFDSGAMPFAQDHYPFTNDPKVFEPKKGLFKKQHGFPADFICEAIDQTRGWFYTLHAIGVLMGYGNAYKNVICLGHILDAEGKKMSKSLGNIVDPWDMIEKYGADTLRLWMYSVNQPGESKNFDEKTVGELNRKVFGLLYNVLSFYELYRDKEIEKDAEKQAITSTSVLDQWIISRLAQLTEYVEENMDNYKLLEPVRAIRDFIDDLSTWYLRRSRERIKEDSLISKMTLYYVLKNLAKIMAPFAPFTAEDIWQTLRTEDDEMSIHLCTWPEVSAIGRPVEFMKDVRDIVSESLKLRQKNGIKVKQPISQIKIKYQASDIYHFPEYIDIIKDEVNVKEVVPDFDSYEKQTDGIVWIDTNITEDLKKEGVYREILRSVQDMRKKTQLVPADVIDLTISPIAEKYISIFEEDLKKIAGIRNVEYKDGDTEVQIEDEVYKISIKKND